MPYRLIVTRPNGSQAHSSAEPLPTRHAVALSALKVLAAQNVAFGRAGLAFGRQLREVPLGETLTHAGYSFRTEQF
ncbi:hypothetical protein RFN58_06885 [Streptomyces iakyrus]|uniref:hypothetical protein n=1 Tax=Streptomyces iakyrus TaxID=68219 RepID=UPI0005269F2E|nr:hypothetical protein [Streptomyces iakyrus]